MAIIGIGTDLIEIQRVKKACARDSFIERVYTRQECRLAEGNASKLAGNFAVKEAVAKALGTGFRDFMPIDIEVLRDSLGKPYAVLHGRAKARFEQAGGQRLHVSISNTANYAVAFVTIEGDDSLPDASDGAGGK